ncbi:hypothetical protein AD998_07600 [bacterium 336/3]|nr:hypothetical protein AD998_07600 [bacterium 336/3]
MEIVELKKLIESPINNLLKNIGTEFKQLAKNRLLEYQTNEYKRNLFAKTFIHRSEPIKLDEFYVPLHIEKHGFIGSERKRISTENISELLKNLNYITIIGSAGSGKSTLMKYFFIDSIKRKFKIPIKVELRYLNEKASFVKYIFEDIFLFHQLGFTNEIIDRILSSGDFIFLFDGYDEINYSKKESITNEIDQFVNKYASNKYVITSRPYTNLDTLPLFHNYSICDLENDEISIFIQKQIPSQEKELIEKIEKEALNLKDSSYRNFLKNPLLLSMFILTYQSYSAIPQKSCDFYKQLFDTLYSTHDSLSKLSFQREKQSKLSKEQFEDILRLFSFISYFEEKFYFQTDYIESKLNVIKENRKIVFDNQKLIEDLKIAIGILNKEGTDYTFPHRSLQEYFAANYIKNLSEVNKKDVLTKIKLNIEKSITYMIDNANFIVLLKELDYISISKYILIPRLIKCIENLKKIDREDFQKQYEVLCQIDLSSLLVPNEFMNISLFSFEEMQYIRTAMRRTYLGLLEFDNYEYRMSIQDIQQISSIIINNGEKWIDEVNQLVLDKEKGDFDIINLV